MCGGKSSRVRQECGADKTMLPLGACDTITEFLHNKLRDHFDTIYLSTKDHKFGDNFNYIIDANSVGDIDTRDIFAPTLSIYSSLKSLKSQVLFVPADMPLLQYSSLEKILKIIEGNDAAVLRIGGKVFPTCAVYSTSVLPILEKMIIQDRHKLQLFLDGIDTIYVDLPDNEEFKNINTYSQYLEIKDR